MPPSASVVLDYLGAVGDGIHDDTTAFEQAFVAAGTYNGPAQIVLTEGKTYRTRRTIKVQRDWSNVTVTGGGTWLSEPIPDGTSTSGAAIHYRALEDEHPIQTFASAAKDATVITRTSTADLAAGDYVIIYTGQVIEFANASGYPLGWPDAEINQVASIDGNDVHLVSPLAKDYAQEYWPDVSGGLGVVTSTTPSAYPAPIGLRKIEPMVGLAFDGINIVHRPDGYAPFIQKGPFAGLTFTDLTVECDGSFMSVDGWTGSMSGCAVHLGLDNAWWFTVAYSARDVAVSNCVFTSDTVGYVHIHEGSSGVSLTDVDITNAAGLPGSLTYPYIIGVRGRNYDVSLTRVSVTNARVNGQGLRVDAGVTGSAVDYVFTGTGQAGGPTGTEGPAVRNESALFTVNGVAGEPW